MRNILPGKKTYIALTATLVTVWANQAGVGIDQETANIIATATIAIAAWGRSVAS